MQRGRCSVATGAVVDGSWLRSCVANGAWWRAEQRVERGDFKADQVVHHLEDVRSPAAAFFAGEDNKASAV